MGSDRGLYIDLVTMQKDGSNRENDEALTRGMEINKRHLTGLLTKGATKLSKKKSESHIGVLLYPFMLCSLCYVLIYLFQNCFLCVTIPTFMVKTRLIQCRWPHHYLHCLKWPATESILTLPACDPFCFCFSKDLQWELILLLFLFLWICEYFSLFLY